MSEHYFIADLHLGHNNIIKFTKPDGTNIRPDFETIEEHDEYIIEQWNKTVGVNDRVYVLGDVVINRKHLSKCLRLNGKKRLIMGNHDIFSNDEYYKAGFEKIGAYRIFEKYKIICCHIPIHPDSLYRWAANVHGHLHCAKVQSPMIYTNSNGRKELLGIRADPRYVCVSLEQVEYKPVSMDWILNKLKEL